MKTTSVNWDSLWQGKKEQAKLLILNNSGMLWTVGLNCN